MPPTLVIAAVVVAATLIALGWLLGLEARRPRERRLERRLLHSYPRRHAAIPPPDVGGTPEPP